MFFQEYHFDRLPNKRPTPDPLMTSDLQHRQLIFKFLSAILTPYKEVTHLLKHENPDAEVTLHTYYLMTRNFSEVWGQFGSQAVIFLAWRLRGNVLGVF